jgi:hypothetical protein
MLEKGPCTSQDTSPTGHPPIDEDEYNRESSGELNCTTRAVPTLPTTISQPGRDAIGAAFIRELEYEMTRLTGQWAVVLDNDPTPCHDAIPCYPANVVSCKPTLQDFP